MSRKSRSSGFVSHSELRSTEVARQIAADIFGNGVSERTVSNVVADIVELAETLTEEQKESDPPAFPIACREGCAYCCYMRVQVTPLEVISLARFIHETFSETELQNLKSRLKETYQITRGMTEEERGESGIPCPLLVDDHCSVYRARPLECRGYASMNVDACRKALDNYSSWNVPLYSPQFSIHKHIQAGLLSALADAGYGFEVLELTAALRIVVEDPNVVERWLEGEDVFEPAALSPADPERLALQPWTPTFDILNIQSQKITEHIALNLKK